MKMDASSAAKAPMDSRTNRCLGGQFNRMRVRYEHLLAVYYTFFYLA
jgi:hypothetical protein